MHKEEECRKLKERLASMEADLAASRQQLTVLKTLQDQLRDAEDTTDHLREEIQTYQSENLAIKEQTR